MTLDAQRYGLEVLLARRRARSRGVVGQGASGTAVRQLQTHLRGLGYDIETDGAYGPKTAEAVRRFQKEHGAKVDGIVGQETFGKLGRAKGRPAPHVSPADTGIDAIGRAVGVKGVGGGRTAARSSRPGRSTSAKAGGSGPKLKDGQRRDAATGAAYNTKKGQSATAGHPIGTTDPTKAAANKALAKDAKQPQDNNPEFNKLHPREGGKFAAKGTATSDQATATQQALNRANGAGLKVDGDFGPKTDSAVRRFQTQQGLKPDGIVGLKTTAALVAASKRRRAS